MRELYLNNCIEIEPPKWPESFVFTLDHGMILGHRIETRHNGVWCKSLLIVDGKPVMQWQVVKVLGDHLLLKSDDAELTMTYKYFPSVNVKIADKEKVISDTTFPNQTRKLYYIGLWLNGTIALMVILGIFAAFYLVK